MKTKNDIIIKVLSLGIGLAVGIVLVAKVFFELSYDSFYSDVDRIYRICTGYQQNGEAQEHYRVSGAVAPGFKAEVPGIEEATRATDYVFPSDKFVDEDGNKLIASHVFADSCFFKVFDRPVLAGDPAKALGKAYCAMVCRSFADRLVESKGDYSSVIGKQIWNEDLKDFLLTIEGVYEDFPKNGSLDYEIVISLESYNKASTENWLGNDRYLAYVRLLPGVDPHGLNDAIRKMQEAHQPLEELEENGLYLWYFLYPFDTMHTSDKEVRSRVILLSIVAILLILISLLNYILIVISSMVKRSKEVGVRKCYGADSRHIYGMLGKEALLHVFLSLIVASVIIFAGRNLVESLLGVPFTTLLVPQSLIAVGVVILFVIAVSIIVPARLYMHVPVYAALKNYTENSRKWKLGLLGVQVLINVFMIVVMIIIARQYSFVSHSDPGYDYKDTYYVKINETPFRSRVMKALKEIPEVKDVAAAYNLPYMGCSGNNVYVPGDPRELFNIADQYSSTENFLDFMGVEFKEGRAPKDTLEVAVDEKFVKKMEEMLGWNDGVVGKQVYITDHCHVFDIGDNPAFYLTISGVYKNYLLGDLRRVDGRPSVMFTGDIYDPHSGMRYIFFKGRPDALPKIRQTVSSVLDGKEVEIVSYEERMRSAYSDNKKMRNTLFIGAIFSLLIALLGLVGFIRDESLRRAKEMAMRKINGADSSEILGAFAGDIMKLSLLMAVVASVCALVVARKWLEHFAEKVSLNPSYFFIGAAFVLLFVLCVVVLNCLRIVRANPVDSLKNE